MASKTALVMRATGFQGRGIIKHLVGHGWHIHALCTDASADRAVALMSMGKNITLFEGTWNDPKAIRTAISGCQALFFNQMPSFDDDSEMREAKAVLDIAKTARVQIVLTTTFPLENPKVREELKDSAAAPPVLGKMDVEDLVKASDLTWTILRPAYFMTNLLSPLIEWMYPEFKERKFVNSYGPDCVLGLTDTDDIGAFAVAAFENPDKYGGQIIPIVSEMMRVDEMLKELEKASGKPIEVVYRTQEETENQLSNPFVAGHVICIGLDKYMDMEKVKSWGIPLTTFKEFLEKHKDEL